MKPKVIKASELIKFRTAIKQSFKNFYGVEIGSNASRKLCISDANSCGGDMYDEEQRELAKINLINTLLKYCRELK